VFPLYNAFNGFSQSLFKFSATTDPSYVYTNSLAVQATARTYIIIPSGHNLAGNTMTVHGSASGAYAGEEVQLWTGAVPAGEFYQLLTTPLTQQYCRVKFQGVLYHAVPQIWIGDRITPVRGPEPEYKENDIPNLLRITCDSGVTGTSILGPVKRTWELKFSGVEAADLVKFNTFNSLVSYGADSFWFHPPDDTQGIHLVVLDSFLVKTQDNPAPKSPLGPTWAIELKMIEAIG